MSKLSSLASGVGWGTVSIVTITMFQLVFMAVMARLLDPADFGLVAIANVSLRFFSYFAQMGIAPALIQKESLSDGDIRSALALSLGVSSLFFMLAISSAGIIEHFFDIYSLATVMRALAINFIVLGFSSISLGLLRRHQAFKKLAIIEIVSYVVGYGVIGLGTAYLGVGVWALVAAFLTQTSFAAALSYSFVRHPISLRHTKEQRRHFIGFGGRYSVIGFIEFLSSNIDALIIGKLMGATPAGYYNRALLLANLPVQHPANVLTKALFPIMSSMSNQQSMQSISVQLSTLLVGSYAFAVGLCLNLAAPDIVRVLLGDKWLEAIPILQVLACSVGPLYVSHVISVTLDSMGELTIKLRIQLSMFVLLVLLIYWVAPSDDVTSIAMAVLVTEWVRVFIMSWVIVRLLKIPTINVFKNILCITLLTITTGIMVFIASCIVSANFSVVLRLIFEILFGVVGMAAGLFFSRYIVSKHTAVMYLASRIPIIERLLLNE